MGIATDDGAGASFGTGPEGRDSFLLVCLNQHLLSSEGHKRDYT